MTPDNKKQAPRFKFDQGAIYQSGYKMDVPDGEEFIQASAYDAIEKERDELKRKDSELIKVLQELTGATNQVNPHLGVAAAVALMQQELQRERRKVQKLREMLESARGTVATHAMQTYSKVSKAKLEEIDEVLEAIDSEGVTGE